MANEAADKRNPWSICLAMNIVAYPSTEQLFMGMSPAGTYRTGRGLILPPVSTSMNNPCLHIIGIVHGDIKRLEDAPKNYSVSTRVGTLEIAPQYLEAMKGLAVGQTIVVLFWLHRASRDVLQVYPRGDRSRGLRGVFTTRSPVRPNPIAVSELQVTSVEGNRIGVLGLDVLDGTPIIDIKNQVPSQPAS